MSATRASLTTRGARTSSKFPCNFRASVSHAGELLKTLSDFGVGGCLMDEMHEKSDAQLLHEYADDGDEAAFREIVIRHTDLIYSSALRQMRSPDLAQDVAQSVFTDLARKAQSWRIHWNKMLHFLAGCFAAHGSRHSINCASSVGVKCARDNLWISSISFPNPTRMGTCPFRPR